MSAADQVESESGRVQACLEVELRVRLGPAQSAGEELMGKPQVHLGLSGRSCASARVHLPVHV